MFHSGIPCQPSLLGNNQCNNLNEDNLIIKTTSSSKVLENETLMKDQMGNNPKTKRAKI